MREILFRGKQVDNGKWVEGSLVHRTKFYGDPTDEYYIIFDGEFHGDYHNSAKVDPETVGQYIGVKDKFGKKVFEGDVVEETCTYATNQRYKISYEDSSFIYVNHKAWSDVIDDGEYGLSIRRCKVVGNIHDNPELLKEKS